MATSFKSCLLLFTCLISFAETHAFVWPKKDALLFQTQVMFSWNEVKGADHYELDIYEIKPSGVAKLVLREKVLSLARLVSKGLIPGKRYEWYNKAFAGAKLLAKSTTLPFTITADLHNDSAGLHFNIPTNELTDDNGCIILDGCGAAIDRKGRVIWKMNETAIKVKEPGISYRNIELSPQGSFTFLVQNSFFETDHSGNILWSAPSQGIRSNDSIEYYHHDGKRLNDGTYLICGFRYEIEPSYVSDNERCRVKYGTLLQLNEKKEVLWWWNEKGHVRPEDIYRNIAPGNYEVSGSHLNGMSIDSSGQRILLSFRDNDRIILIDRKTGDVMEEWRPDNSKGLMFSGQHSPVFINEHGFVFYNNCLTRGLDKKGIAQNASVIVMQQQADGYFRKQREFVCASDSFPEGTTGKEGFCQPLANGNMLICVGGKNMLLEVDEKDHIVWRCFTRSLNKKDGRWEALPSYRAHYYSSLYPRYFTVEQMSSPKPGTIRLKINNDGTEDDRYEVVVVTAAGEKVLASAMIRKQQQMIVQFKPEKGRLLVRPMGIAGYSWIVRQ